MIQLRRYILGAPQNCYKTETVLQTCHQQAPRFVLVYIKLNNVATMCSVSPLRLMLLLSLGSGVFHFSNGKCKEDVSNLSMSSCGISKVAFDDGDRIVGGRDALEGEFPWQISLRYKNFFIRPTHICGGTILNKMWIITAAHCVYKRYAKNFEVLVGAWKQEQPGKYDASYQVAEIIWHENFTRETFDNDIALLRLEKEISFENSEGYVNGICLPDCDQNVTGFVITTGWGDKEEDGDGSNTLQAVKLPILPQYICTLLFASDDAITKNMVCAGLPEGGIDSCQGDSGGPLIQRNDKGIATLLGITSWGIGCARPLLPGIYTAVPNFVNWIQRHAK